MTKKPCRKLLGSYLWRVQHLFFVFFFVVFTQISSPVFSAQKLSGKPKLNTASDTADIIAQWIMEMMDKNGGDFLSADDANLLNDCLRGQTYRKGGNPGSIVLELDETHGPPHLHLTFIQNGNPNWSDHSLIPGSHPLHRIPIDPTDYSQITGRKTPFKLKPNNGIPDCPPSEIPTKINYSAPTIQTTQGTPSGTGSGTGRGYLRGFGNVISPGDLAERLLGLWDGTGEVIDQIRNNRAQITQLFSTSALLARYYALSAGKAAISYAPAAGVAAGAGAAAVAPAAISYSNLEYSQSQVNAAKANGGYTYIPGPVQTSGPNSIWVYGRVYVGPKGQLYQATSWGFSPVYNTYSDYWSGTKATIKR